MKKNFFISLTLFSLLWMTNGHAQENTLLTETIKGAIKDLVEDNAVFASERARHDFKEFLDIQNPRVTMILCSDSRVQTDNFSQGAENDIFVARNIGNQFITTAGSIEYGVNVLKTPVLMIVGHSHCGAIKAAMGDVTSLPAGIRKEVETIDVKAAKDDKQGVIENVHYQVEKALNQFKDKVNASQLAVVGAVYDFRNDYGYGYGQLIIVDLNGEKNPEKIKNSHYFDNIKKVSIGVN